MSKHLVLFDDTCSLCCNATEKIKNWDKKNLFSLIPLGSAAAHPFLKENTRLKHSDSLILVESFNSPKRRIWLRGRAVMRILWLLGGWCKLIGWMAYLPFGVDGAYRLIARHRHRFNKR